MNNLSLIVYNFGKFWITVVLFIAMAVSAVVSLPFIAIGKILDMWRAHQLHSSTDQMTRF